MANYYVKASFTLKCLPEEANCLVAASTIDDTLPEILEPFFADMEEYAQLFDDPDYPSLDVQIDENDEGVDIYGEYCVQIYSLASLIQKLAPSALPTGFIWIGDCDKPRLDAYEGGYIWITADSITHKSLTEMLTSC